MELQFNNFSTSSSTNSLSLKCINWIEIGMWMQFMSLHYKLFKQLKHTCQVYSNNCCIILVKQLISWLQAWALFNWCKQTTSINSSGEKNQVDCAIYGVDCVHTNHLLVVNRLEVTCNIKEMLDSRHEILVQSLKFGKSFNMIKNVSLSLFHLSCTDIF